jgi:hypothetical protein
MKSPLDALLRLMSIKEEVEDPQIVQRIHSILIPREFTRLDEIADILFSAAEEIKQETVEVENEDDQVTAEKKSKEPKFTPVAFHDACIARIQAVLNETLVKRTRAQYSTPDKLTIINCSVSKEHGPETNPNYWFAFHPHQREVLEKAQRAFIAFGCGNSKRHAADIMKVGCTVMPECVRATAVLYIFQAQIPEHIGDNPLDMTN